MIFVNPSVVIYILHSVSFCFKRSIRSIKPQHHNISKQGSCSDVQEAWTRRSREAFSSNVTECVAVQGSRCLSVCVLPGHGLSQILL